jgi:hypothetical protein
MGKQWQPIALQLQRQNVTLGQTLNIQGVLQDSYTSEFLIMVEGTVTTAAATAAIEGLPALIQKVLISGPLPGYNTLTPINGLSGPMLSEFAQFKRRNVSYSFGSLASTGKFGVSIPCTFLNQRLGGAWARMSCLPTNIMGAVNFNIQIASQAQVDTNATPTFAASPLTVYVQQNEYKASTIPPLSALVPASQVQSGAFQFIPSSLNYLTTGTMVAGSAIQQLFPNGTYLALLLRAFSTTASGVATARQSDTVAGGPIDLSVTSPGLILQDVNQQPKSAVTWYTIRKDNLDNIYDSLVTGNACFQFNNRAWEIFQPAIGPNQIPLIYPVTLTGTTNPRVDFVYEQIFDSMNWLGLI